VGAVLSDGIGNGDRVVAAMDNEEHGEVDCDSDSGADCLSVMYPPCQDPLLAKIYQGLPTLPYVEAIYLIFLITKISVLSSRLCEVKAYSGSVDSLRTPFKETCENMTKSEIGYVSISY
jgi:hypothetical protein